VRPGRRAPAHHRGALGVKIAHRHEQFKIDGPKAKANDALELLQALYEMADAPSGRYAAAHAGRRHRMLEQPRTPSSFHAPRRPARARPTRRVPGEHRLPRHHLRHRPGRHRQDLPGRPAPWTRWSAAPCSASC
jgi:hypothetical protein